MSTFNGFIKEFPLLGVDYFRPRKSPAIAACAYLLSHVHADHLQGLENPNFGGAFIYCSAITKALLLNTQTKRAQAQYYRGELAARHYKYGHLRQRYGRTQDLLKALPLNQPICLEVGKEILHVTLLDANHCPGAVMFLIESTASRVLYTGDIRAEPSFISALHIQPALLPYLAKRQALDCIYLDTTARVHGPAYRSKQAGCMELLDILQCYNQSTIFNVAARCLGYESIYLAIARAFDTTIHVGAYTYSLYAAAADVDEDGYAALILTCLTRDPNSTRFHSCSSVWDECQIFSKSTTRAEVIYIKPVSHEKNARPLAAINKIPSVNKIHNIPSLHQTNPEVTIGFKARSNLPDVVFVEFARHSSWQEQRTLIEILCPREVQSCTGESSHLYQDLCHLTAPLDENMKCSEASERDQRRLCLGAKYSSEVAKSDWAQSSRMIRKKLAKDIQL